ncbi:hypothetical protein [Novosphingobium album (ex Liu et al. 2023)]|uniref:Uncharacterized protein n=1 Tax=Novosphingobium album (ex Liu et al. 2023) TaxID=3031130 RepID=A0ABT5WXI7_9SPHN|nr:hypothetical protein [Novosphingobium album (ex Liu et al. 2023)]MDE8654628.1 hypothetical protein [Novosphingobium album (ex Liu et al. 2023)]
MAIEIAGWSRYENAQRRFADTRARKIDSRIDEILVSFAAFAAGRKVEREERASGHGLKRSLASGAPNRHSLPSSNSSGWNILIAS